VSTYSLALPPGVSLGAGDTIALTTLPPVTTGSISAAIAAAQVGDTVTMAPGTYKERVIVPKALTLNLAGVVMDGTGLGVPLQQGLFSVQAPCTVNGGRTTNSGGAGIDVSGVGGGSTINDFETDHNVQEGYHGTGVANVAFNRLRTHDNDLSNAVYSGGEQGGGKLSRCDGWTFTDCQAYSNGGGPGFWADIHCHNTRFIRCIAHDNYGAGIMDEASWSSYWEACVGWHNGKQNAGWAWDANFLVSSSSGAELNGCVSAWANGGIDGISLIAQSRASDYPDIKPYTGANVHDCISINTSASRLLTWPEPDKTAYPTAIWSGAVAARNSYYPARPTLDQFASETGAIVLTATQLAAVLTKYGIPSA